MRIVHHMKLAHKFLILGLVFLTLVAVPTGVSFTRSLTDIGIARRELQGTVPLVARMDPTTQQNAALVEEIAAAADSLHRQSQQLLETASVFKW